MEQFVLVLKTRMMEQHKRKGMRLCGESQAWKPTPCLLPTRARGAWG